MGTALVPRARETPLQKKKQFKRRAKKTLRGFILAKETRKDQKEGQED